MITREALEARLTQLRQEVEQMRANLNAYEGAIQDCEYWLGVITAQELAARQGG